MTMTSARRTGGEPTPDLARGLGLLLVASTQLSHVATQVAAIDQPDVGRLDAARTQWCEVASDLLDLRARIDEAVAGKVFTGSAGDHLVIEGRGGIVIPADAGYLTVLSKRMDRHTRAGRMFAMAVTA